MSSSLFSGALPSPVWNGRFDNGRRRGVSGRWVVRRGGASCRGRLFPGLCLRVERLAAVFAELDACAVSEQTDVPLLVEESRVVAVVHGVLYRSKNTVDFLLLRMV